MHLQTKQQFPPVTAHLHLTLTLMKKHGSVRGNEVQCVECNFTWPFSAKTKCKTHLTAARFVCVLCVFFCVS